MLSTDVNSDIAQFVEASLEQRLQDGRLQLGDPNLILIVRDVLIKRAHGMLVS